MVPDHSKTPQNTFFEHVPGFLRGLNALNGFFAVPDTWLTPPGPGFHGFSWISWIFMDFYGFHENTCISWKYVYLQYGGVHMNNVWPTARNLSILWSILAIGQTWFLVFILNVVWAGWHPVQIWREGSRIETTCMFLWVMLWLCCIFTSCMSFASMCGAIFLVTKMVRIGDQTSARGYFGGVPQCTSFGSKYP